MRTKEQCLDDAFSNTLGRVIISSDLKNGMDYYAEEVAIDYENWKKSMGIKWSVDNAYTPAVELFQLYKKEKGLQ